MTWKQWIAWKLFGQQYVVVLWTSHGEECSEVLPMKTSPAGECLVEVQGRQILLNMDGTIRGGLKSASWKRLTPDPVVEKLAPGHLREGLRVNDILQITGGDSDGSR